MEKTQKQKIMTKLNFRVWETREGLQQMYFNCSFVPYGEGWSGGNPKYKFYEINHSNGFFKADDSNIIIMQSTGLIDKNNKETFDGDIIKIKVSGIVNEPVYKWISKVSWYETHAMFGFTTKHGWLSFNHQHFVEFEIIGNIHQNPKLLK